MDEAVAGGSSEAPQVREVEGKPGDGRRWTATSLIALLSSLIAVFIPVTQAIQGWRDVSSKEKEIELKQKEIDLRQKENERDAGLKQKEFEGRQLQNQRDDVAKAREFERDSALKSKDLEQKITVEFMQLAISKDTAAADRKQVLDVLARLETPLRGWAKERLGQIQSEIQATSAQNSRLQSAISRTQDQSARYAVAVAMRDDAVFELNKATEAGDLEHRQTWIAKLVAANEEVLKLGPQVDAPLEVRLDVRSVGAGGSGPGERTGAGSIGPGDLSVSRVTDFVLKVFPRTGKQVADANVPALLDAFREFGLADRAMLLVGLATVNAEVGNFAPATERASRFNTSPGGQPFDMYDSRKELGNTGSPDGEKYRGRGYLLITGRANYTRVSQDLGLGTALVDNPERENDPTIAARTLALFLKRRESAIRTAYAKKDWTAVRRLVSGGSNGMLLFTAVIDAAETFR